jgi:uncharacterized repeat protein (TIGR01451 family)
LTSAISLLLSTMYLAAIPVLATPGDEHKATICHRTNSETNPYVQITVDYAALDGDKKNDHSHHEGPVWYPGAKAAGVKWGDIIPPIEGVNPGQNWTDEGRAIYDNGCAGGTGTGECIPASTLSNSELRDLLKAEGSGVSDPQVVSGSTATSWTAVVAVPAELCDVKVSFSSYSLPGGYIQPFDEQVLFDNVTATYLGGTESVVSVALPENCGWQVDLYLGDVIAQLNAQYGHPGDRLIDWSYQQTGEVCGGETELTADVSIVKWADDDEVDAGDSVGYGLKVTNNGTGTATNVTVTDNTLDLPLIFSAPTASQGTCAIDGTNNLTCSLGDIAAGGEVTITFVAETTEEACPRAINRATVAADNDSDTTNNVSNAVTVKVNCEEPEEPGDAAALNIRKVDDQGNRLAGAVFTVEGMEGTFTTGANGHFCITGLEEDSVWLVTEIQAPAGYEIAEEASQLVEVDDDGDCRSPDAVFVNTLAEEEESAALKIRKVDEEGNRLPGAVFEIDGMEGTFTTNEAGEFCVTGLDLDTWWTVTEIQAPAGYEIADEASQLVEADDDGDCNSPDAVFVNSLAEEEPNEEEPNEEEPKTEPTPRENELGGNPTPTPGTGNTLPDTALVSTGAPISPAVGALVALVSLLVLVAAQLAEVRARR